MYPRNLSFVSTISHQGPLESMNERLGSTPAMISTTSSFQQLDTLNGCRWSSEVVAQTEATKRSNAAVALVHSMSTCKDPDEKRCSHLREGRGNTNTQEPLTQKPLNLRSMVAPKIEGSTRTCYKMCYRVVAGQGLERSHVPLACQFR